MSSSLNFHKALITGGAGGIGKAMAKYFIGEGKKVVIAGRTESKLRDAVKELGNGTCYYVLDTGDIPSIAPFVEKLLDEHPDIDCLVNNAGIQVPLSFDSSFSLSKADQEININIRGPMHLIISLLPHFRARSSAVIINVSSVLGYIPFSVQNPVYNGTKAWLHFFTVNLREQLNQSSQSSQSSQSNEEKSKENGGSRGGNIKIIEIVPPTVESDLHRERDDPDDNKKEKNQDALSMDEFMGYVRKGMESGKEVIGAGMSEGVVERWYREFGEEGRVK